MNDMLKQVLAPAMQAHALAVEKVRAASDFTGLSDGELYARFEGANRVVYWIACMQRGATGGFRGELFDVRRRALQERDWLGQEMGRRKLELNRAEFDEANAKEWMPTP